MKGKINNEGRECNRGSLTGNIWHLNVLWILVLQAFCLGYLLKTETNATKKKNENERVTVSVSGLWLVHKLKSYTLVQDGPSVTLLHYNNSNATRHFHSNHANLQMRRDNKKATRIKAKNHGYVPQTRSKSIAFKAKVCIF